MREVLRTAEAAGLHGEARVRNKIERGYWQRPTRGVVVTHNGPISDAERDAIALAAAPPGSVLGGATALAYDGFAASVGGKRSIVVPAGSRRVKVDDVITHWSTMLDDADVHPLRAPLRTRPARSLIDLASWSANDRYARWVIVAGVQQGLAGTRQLREALTRRGPCRWRSLIVESILDSGGGIQSLPERDFSEICRLIGLPRPTRQRPTRGRIGLYYLDAWWEQFGFGVEIHGIPHLSVERWDADLFRANEITIGGDHLLTFSSYAVRRHQAEIADQLVRMARSHGWPGGTDLSTIEWPQQRRRRKIRPSRGR